MQFTVHNMVITVKFSDDFIDLNKIVDSLEGAEYEPAQFPGLVYRMKKPKASFLIFTSGKMTCTGAASLEIAKKAINKMLKLLKQIGFKIQKPKTEVQNIVASSEFGRSIDLEKVSQLEGTEYDTGQFPGLVYRMKKGAVFLVFGTGKIVCVGTRSVKQIEESTDYLAKKLKRIRAFK